MNKIEMNLNKSECMRVKTFLTHTEYINICNGEIKTAKNGIGDYLVMSMIFIFLIAMLSFVIYFIKTLFFDN